MPTIMDNLNLDGQVIAEGLLFPEGPVALFDGSFLVVEMARGTLTRIYDDRTEVIAHLGGGPNGAAVGPNGQCFVCNNGGSIWGRPGGGPLRPIAPDPKYSGGSIQRVDLSNGMVETLYTHCNGVALNAPNDLVFDTDGGFWFTDFGRRHDRVRDEGVIYYAESDGSKIEEVAFPVAAPNGIGLSPDQKSLYVTETETARLWAFPVVSPGKLSIEPWPSPNGGRLIFGAGGYQRFDSIAVEETGNICIATLIKAGILVVSPRGDFVEFYCTDDPFCTNVCFGGENMKTAVVTLSGTGKLIKLNWPRQGRKLAF